MNKHYTDWGLSEQMECSSIRALEITLAFMQKERGGLKL
jgi:hypothetical protein